MFMLAPCGRSIEDQGGPRMRLKKEGHQRASYASGDFDAKYIPGIVFLIPGITRIQFTVLRSCGIPNSPFVNFVLAYS